MDATAAYETSQRLLSLAREHGHEVSRAQLARWHRAGLLPRPRQRARGRARGTHSLYAPGTGEQLLLLCALRTRERRLACIAWQLWWAGYPVALPVIRQQLQEAAARLSRLVAWCVALKQADEIPSGSASDAAYPLLDAIERYAQAPLASKPLRRIRKRIGRANFPTLLRMLIEIASGTFEGYGAAADDNEALADLRVLARGLGLDERFIRQRANLEHYMGRIVVPLLRRAGPWIRSLPWERTLHAASDFELLQARDALRMLLKSGADALTRDRRLCAEYPLWSVAFHSRFGDVGRDDQAMLLVVWIALRSR